MLEVFISWAIAYTNRTEYKIQNEKCEKFNQRNRKTGRNLSSEKKNGKCISFLVAGQTACGMAAGCWFFAGSVCMCHRINRRRRRWKLCGCAHWIARLPAPSRGDIVLKREEKKMAAHLHLSFSSTLWVVGRWRFVSGVESSSFPCKNCWSISNKCTLSSIFFHIFYFGVLRQACVEMVDHNNLNNVSYISAFVTIFVVRCISIAGKFEREKNKISDSYSFFNGRRLRFAHQFEQKAKSAKPNWK